MNHRFKKEAWSVLTNSAKNFGFVATAQDTDNYARLWSRDSAIASLAVLSHGKEVLYPAVKSSILNLLEAVGEGGEKDVLDSVERSIGVCIAMLEYLN